MRKEKIVDETRKRDWSKLKDTRCVFCSKKLTYRTRHKETKIRARNFNQSRLSDDYWFCFKCDFQISNDKLKRLQGIPNEEPKYFKTGLLQM